MKSSGTGSVNYKKKLSKGGSRNIEVIAEPRSSDQTYLVQNV